MRRGFCLFATVLTGTTFSTLATGATNMIQEKRMHAAIKDYLRDINITHELTIYTAEMFKLPYTKVKLDFYGNRKGRDFIIECKNYAHPYYIAQALGQLLVYKSILRIKELSAYPKDNDTAVFLCFPNFPMSTHYKWTEEHDKFLATLQKDLIIPIGLLLVEPGGLISETQNISDDEDYPLTVKLKIIPHIDPLRLFTAP